MKKFEISKNRRVKITPYTSRLESYGVGGYTVYNHMLLPTYFKSLEDEYFHLKKMFNYGMSLFKSKLKLAVVILIN